MVLSTSGEAWRGLPHMPDTYLSFKYQYPKKFAFGMLASSLNLHRGARAPQFPEVPDETAKARKNLERRQVRCVQAGARAETHHHNQRIRQDHLMRKAHMVLQHPSGALQKMKKTVFVASLGIAALLAGPVSALTLYNEDAATHEVTVITGQGDADAETVVIESGTTLGELCMDGCTMQLPNGISQSFGGSEEVSIVDGEFVIAE